MKNMKMSFFLTEKWSEKGKIQFFHVIFLNKNISITVLDIVLKFCIPVLHTHSEEKLSHIFYLGPSLYFM